MRSTRSPDFVKLFNNLPKHIQREARKAYKLWKKDPHHPSLHFKLIDAKANTWSVRISLGYRALGIKTGDVIVWEWIGSHNTYDKLI